MQNIYIWMENIDIWIQASKRIKTGRIFVCIGLLEKAGMAARKIKSNRLVSAGSIDEQASVNFSIERKLSRITRLS